MSQPATLILRTEIIHGPDLPTLTDAWLRAEQPCPGPAFQILLRHTSTQVEYPISVHLSIHSLSRKDPAGVCIVIEGTYTLAEEIALYVPWQGYYFARYDPATHTGEIILQGLKPAA